MPRRAAGVIIIIIIVGCQMSQSLLFNQPSLLTVRKSSASKHIRLIAAPTVHVKRTALP